MLHTVIRNAWAGDPYRIDTLLMFMANMSWNSAMNTRETIDWLTDKDASGDYKIPRIIYSDAYASEMVAYADLVLPDTTYLERFDAISLLDRPISDADARQPTRSAIRCSIRTRSSRTTAAARRARLPVGAARPRRAARPARHGRTPTARRAYRDYADYIVRHERAPGVGLLAGWRGEDGAQSRQGRAESRRSCKRYIDNGGFWHEAIPETARYYKMANRGYLQWAQRFGFVASDAPIVLQLYSETLQKFRLAAQGHGALQPPPEHRERVATYFDPLPIWYEPFEHDQTSRDTYPVERGDAAADVHVPRLGFAERVAAADRHAQLAVPASGHRRAARHRRRGLDRRSIRTTARISVQAKFAGNMQPDTVWSWNAIGKRKGAWKLAKDAPEGSKGFLLNHLISDITPQGRLRQRRSGHRAGGVVRPARVDPQGRGARAKARRNSRRCRSAKPANSRCAMAPACATRSIAARPAP